MRLVKYFFLLLCIPLLMGCNQENKKNELKLIGHRGAMGLMPENTIPGFKKAVELGVDGIELDVVISGDDQVIVSHEPWFRHDICIDSDGGDIKEENQKEHLIYQMTYEEIAQYDCGSVQHPDFPDQQAQSLSKPLLKEAINEVEAYITENDFDLVSYHIEFKRKSSWDTTLQPKPPKVVQLVYDELAELGILDRVTVHSFDKQMLQAFRDIDPTVPQMYSIPSRNTDLEANLTALGYTPDVYFSNYTMVDSNLVKEVHNKEMLMIPWTVDEYDEMVRLINSGVDGILSNYPNHFRKLRES